MNPLGLFLRTSIPFMWRILSASLPSRTPWLRSDLVLPGAVTTANAAPRGVVNIGPLAMTKSHNNEWCTLEGVHVIGPGISWSYAAPDLPVDPVRLPIMVVHITHNDI